MCGVGWFFGVRWLLGWVSRWVLGVRWVLTMDIAGEARMLLSSNTKVQPATARTGLIVIVIIIFVTYGLSMS